VRNFFLAARDSSPLATAWASSPEDVDVMRAKFVASGRVAEPDRHRILVARWLTDEEAETV
jgi:hypothetical protein